MELRHLRYFVAVAEELNITRAAARLHVSQPPLSRQIRDLECELGVDLIEHGAKPVRLTEAGKIFFTEAQAVLNRAAEAIKAARVVAKGGGGEIHVGYAPSLTVELLPKILRLFQEQAPQVQVRLHDLSSEEMLKGLGNGKLDVALMIRFGAKSRKGLVFEELQRYALCAALPLTHPQAMAKKIEIRQLLRERLIGYTRQDYPEYHQMLDQLFAPYGPTPPIAEEHDGVASLITSVEAGRGLALAPQSFACLAGPRLRIVPLSPAPSKLVVGIAYRAGKLTTVQNRFIEAAKLGVETKPAVKSRR
ncbi:MAG: LysR family transcriptional regulator [Verrucomicrobiales bacterium]|jgi:DNA-binding transcriptional LysR family regulator|nr:LysR family transcriptional regulator [Verrucomicrobiales bacterium]